MLARAIQYLFNVKSNAKLSKYSQKQHFEQSKLKSARSQIRENFEGHHRPGRPWTKLITNLANWWKSFAPEWPPPPPPHPPLRKSCDARGVGGGGGAQNWRLPRAPNSQDTPVRFPLPLKIQILIQFTHFRRNFWSENLHISIGFNRLRNHYRF